MTSEKIILPAAVEKTLYIGIGVGSFNFNKIQVTEFSPEHQSSGFESVPLKSQKITISLADADIKDESGVKKAFVETLKSQQEKIKADSHIKVQALQDRIDNLLAIEYQPNA